MNKVNKRVVKAVKIIVLLSLIGITAVFGISHYIETSGRKHIIDTTQLKPAQTAIVLGARVYSSGRVSPMLEDRLNTAIDLYLSGTVKKLLLTGDHGQVSYDEVNAMRQFALEGGVAAEDIFLDHAGFSTYDSMYRARDIFRVDRAIVVTQEFHLPRAVYIARSMGLDAVGAIADRHIYVSEGYYELREVLARNKAFMQLFILNSQPKYLGEAIPITGDGRLTWDTL